MIPMTTIQLNNVLCVAIDAGMLDFAMSRVARHTGSGHTTMITIYIDQRKPDGWLEWGMNIEYDDGGKLFLGLIQRGVGCLFEAHS